ncbi:MAG: oxygenase MpaB family protein [Acidimicrobiales bacterium]
MVRTRGREALARLRLRFGRSIRDAAGLTSDPPPRCDDPKEAFGDVHGVARLVHRELPSMLIGGVGSLFFQMLHPHAMAGVAEHSRYQEDPLARVLRTANFIGATTFGSRASAQVVIDRVLEVHGYVHGIADDGQPYDANDSHLLLWVHCAEIYMFLNAYRRFGSQRLTGDEADHYVKEMVPLARALGADDPPQTVAELNAALLSFRGELRLSTDGVAARDFIAYGVMKSRTQRLVYRLLVLSAWSLLPAYAQELLGVRQRGWRERFIVRPATQIVCYAMRVAVPPPPHVAIVRPPSTVTT